jgi:hypothetical protein
MLTARARTLLVFSIALLVLALATGEASALSPSDPGPTPSVSGIPAATTAASVTFTATTTVPDNWWVDLSCEYGDGFPTPCDDKYFPECNNIAGGMQTCTQTISHATVEGSQRWRVYGVYCDEASIEDCIDFDSWITGPGLSTTFTVDRIAPVISVTGGPSLTAPVLKPNYSFTFGANEGATFGCAIDNAPFANCVSPLALSAAKLKNGLHQFRLSATDALGNVSLATTSFTVDIFHPKKCKSGHSKRAKAKYKKCKAKNVAGKKAWKKKHHLH